MIKYFYWPKDGTLIGTTASSQSEHKSNGNEGVLHIPQKLKNCMLYNYKESIYMEEWP